MNVDMIYIIIGVGVLVVSAILFVWWTRVTKVVKQRSVIMQMLFELNAEYNFYKLNQSQTHRDRHQRKNKFDRDTPYDFMKRHLFENVDYYKVITAQVNKNQNDYHSYMAKYNTLDIQLGQTDLSGESKLGKSIFLAFEKRLYKKEKLAIPVTDIKYRYHISYTSPKGRNSYYRETAYNNSVVKQELAKVINDIKHRKTRQYQIKQERSKMTDSVRYDVLKRDNYRCQICGSTAQDGVKLHVDHIQPVAKGGKTIKSNLRVLCDRCNMGKSDKF